MKLLASLAPTLMSAAAISGCLIVVETDELEGGCKPDEKPCDGQCVSRSEPEFGCGDSSCQPCFLPNAQTVCDKQLHCAIATCFGNFEDCNHDPDDGCEVNKDTDVNHCGSCEAEACDVPGAFPACARGICAIRKCKEGYKDCNRDSDDGCEVEVLDNDEHCGGCGLQCESPSTCSEGQCQ